MTYLLGAEGESDLLVLMVHPEDAVLDLVPPQQFVPLQVLDAVVVGDELVDPGPPDVRQILFGIVPGFWRPDLEQACQENELDGERKNRSNMVGR